VENVHNAVSGKTISLIMKCGNAPRENVWIAAIIFANVIVPMNYPSLKERDFLTNQVKYFSDPRFYGDNAFYTYENISPQYLKVVRRITL
jgi:hypothetical protein